MYILKCSKSHLNHPLINKVNLDPLQTYGTKRGFGHFVLQEFYYMIKTALNLGVIRYINIDDLSN